MGAGHIVRVRGFGQVQRHEGFERHPVGQGGEDAVAVGRRLIPGHDRRHEVRHDDRAGEVACAFRQDTLKHRAVAQMQVPVVGAADDEAVGHAPRLAHVDFAFQ